MNNSLTSSFESILAFLLSQSIASIPLFAFAVFFSWRFRYRFPNVQYSLWMLFIVRFTLPVDFLVNTYLSISNPITLLKIPELHLSTGDLFFPADVTMNGIQQVFNWTNLFFYGWLSGILFFSIRYFYLRYRIGQLHKNSYKFTAATHIQWLKIWRKRLHIKRNIEIKFSYSTNSAFNLGIIRPTILLPHHYQNMNMPELDLIIGHECVHIKRFDNLQLLFQYIIQSIFFFNPLVWLANRFINLSREQICDTMVMQKAQVSAQFYGSVLLDSIYQPGIAGLNSGFNIHQFVIKQRLLTLNRSQNMNRILFILLIVSSLALSAFSLDGNLPDTTQQQDSKHQTEFVQPIKTGRISSKFGKRMHPILKIERMHQGIDIAAPKGTPIYATADGKVVFAAEKGNYGKLIIIDHTNDYQTRYAQLSEIKVTSEEMVSRGQLIGLVGSSGRSTAPHLHYEVRKNGKPLDPQELIEFVF